METILQSSLDTKTQPASQQHFHTTKKPHTMIVNTKTSLTTPSVSRHMTLSSPLISSFISSLRQRHHITISLNCIKPVPCRNCMIQKRCFHYSFGHVGSAAAAIARSINNSSGNSFQQQQRQILHFSLLSAAATNGKLPLNLSRRCYSSSSQGNNNKDPISKRSTGSSKFGIQSKFTEKIPKYQARLEKGVDRSTYYNNMSTGFFLRIAKYFRDNPIPKDASRTERIQFFIRKYLYIYLLIFAFWGGSYALYKTITSTNAKVLNLEPWEEIVKDTMYVRRVNFLINGRMPMSGNCCAVKMSNGDVLYYNAVPPTEDTIQFLTALLNAPSPQQQRQSPNDDATHEPTIHLIVPNDLAINFASDYFPYHDNRIFNLKFYCHEKNRSFLKYLEKWIKLSDKALPVVFVESETDFPNCIWNDFSVKIISELTNLHEIVLYHRDSQMAIMGEITQNIVPGKTLPTDRLGTRWVEKYMLYRGKIGTFGTIAPQLIQCDDKKALVSKIQDISAWKFEGIVMARGEIVKPGDMQAVHLEFLRRWLGALASKAPDDSLDPTASV